MKFLLCYVLKLILAYKFGNQNPTANPAKPAGFFMWSISHNGTMNTMGAKCFMNLLLGVTGLYLEIKYFVTSYPWRLCVKCFQLLLLMLPKIHLLVLWLKPKMVISV